MEPEAGDDGVSLEVEKAALLKRIEELSLQEIQDCQAEIRELEKTLEDTQSKFKTNSRELEKEIDKVEDEKLQLVAQIKSFKEEKSKEIEDLSFEVANLIREMYGKEPKKREEHRARYPESARARFLRRQEVRRPGYRVQLPVLVNDYDSMDEVDE